MRMHLVLSIESREINDIGDASDARDSWCRFVVLPREMMNECLGLLHVLSS